VTGLVFLGGGGSEVDEAALWAEAFLPGSRVAIWPFAHRAADVRRAAGAWATEALLAIGVEDVDVWVTTEPGLDRRRLDEPRARGRRDLDGVDVVAVPGGGSLYGGSAGAVLAGADVDLARAADPDDVGTTDTRGLDRVHGHDVLPHWTDDQEAAARRHSRASGRPVLAIPERGGVVVARDGTARSVGPDDVQVITAERTVRRAVGEEWSLR